MSIYRETYLSLRERKKGIDSFLPTEISEFKNLIKECNLALKSIGKINYGSTTAVKNQLKKEGEYYTLT